MTMAVLLQPNIVHQSVVPETLPTCPVDPMPVVGTTISESTLGMSTTTTVMVTINLASSAPMSDMEVLGLTLPAGEEPRWPTVHTTFGRSSKA